MARACQCLIAVVAASLIACGEAPAPESKRLVSVEGLELITVAPITADNLRPWDGIVESVNQATLSAQTSGSVSALMVDVNSIVRAGDVLVHISNVEQKSGKSLAMAQLQAAQAQAVEAEADFKRASDTYADEVISKAQYEQALARRDGARAQLAAARAQLTAATQRLDYTVVRAPFAGVIGKRFVQVGETVAPGQAVFSINSPEQLRVRVALPPPDAALLEQSKSAKIVLNNGNEINVQSITIFPEADPDTHTVTVRLSLPINAADLKPGIVVKALLPTSGDMGLLIPSSSVVVRSEVSSVYVVGENSIRLRQIRLGHRAGNQVQVLAGLNPGESIAADPLAASVRLAEKQSER